MVYVEGGKIKEAVKAKGVPKDQRTMKMIEDLMFGIDEEGNETYPMAVRRITTWAKQGAGVTVYPRAMIVRPTLTKRMHNKITQTSLPFKTIVDQMDFKKKYDEGMKEQKEMFKEEI